jgi:hypothetical protein
VALLVVKLPPALLSGSESHKPHHHDKVETPLGGVHTYRKTDDISENILFRVEGCCESVNALKSRYTFDSRP